jgi:hypothetical protein
LNCTNGTKVQNYLAENRNWLPKCIVLRDRPPEKELNVFNQCPIDIFRIEHLGVRWLESAATLEDAKARIQQFAERHSGQYLVVNQLTGNKFVFTAGRASAASV